MLYGSRAFGGRRCKQGVEPAYLGRFANAARVCDRKGPNPFPRRKQLTTAQFLRGTCGAVCLLALLIAPAAFAEQSNGGDRSLRVPTASPEAAPATSPRTATPEEMLAAIEQLRGLVETQNRQIAQQQAELREQARRLEALQRRMEQVATAGPSRASAGEPAAATAAALPPESSLPRQRPAPEQSLAALAESQQQLAQRVAQVEAGAATALKAAEGKFRQLGNFTFSGDLRLRYEPFFGGGPVSSPAPESQHRPRLRLRFNVNARFSPEWTGGFSVASGDDTDPISTNQTLTAFFTRKAFRLDRAFVEYTPGWMKTALRNRGEFKFTAGKFGYTWYRTELTLDNDVNVEGISQTLALHFKNPVFKNITLVAFQLPFHEVSSGPDSFLHGGQIQTQWQLGSRARFGGYIGFYDFNRADPIRAAQIAGTLTGSSNHNAATATQFASKFGVLDLIGRLDFTTWSMRWPLMLQFNYAANTRACTNLVNIAAPPVCDPSDRHAYWAEVQIGQNHEPRDLQFGYTFLRIEREAVLGAFNLSDLRAPSNVLTHRFNVGYQAYRNVNLSFISLLGRHLTTATSAQERILKRLQFDVTYKF
jgi:hypothetical protein